MSSNEEKDTHTHRSHLSPHDRYLRGVMVDPKIAYDFLKNHLPSAIQSRIDLETLELQTDSFINDKLRLQVSDLLYAVKIQKQPSYIYVLLEHASKPDRLLPFRMLRYIVEIMEYHLIKTESKILPVVYPLILYTGKRSFNHSLDLFDLFEERKSLARAIYTNPFQLVDLTHASDKELERYTWFRAAALFSKHIHDTNILPFLNEVMELLRKLENCGEFRYIDLSISYVIEAGNVSDKNAFHQTITRGLTCIDEDKTMIIGEQLKKEGFKQGIKQGLAQGIEQGIEQGKEQSIRAMARNMLAENISLDLIVKLTGISIKELKSLQH